MLPFRIHDSIPERDRFEFDLESDEGDGEFSTEDFLFRYEICPTTQDFEDFTIEVYFVERYGSFPDEILMFTSRIPDYVTAWAQMFEAVLRFLREFEEDYKGNAEEFINSFFDGSAKFKRPKAEWMQCLG